MPVAYELATKSNFADIVLDTYAQEPISIVPDTGAQTAVIRKIIAAEGGELKSHVHDYSEWLGSVAPAVHFHNYLLAPGKIVDRFDVLARLILVGTDARLLFAQLDRVMLQMEELLGIAVLRGYLSEPRPVTDFIGAA